MPRILLSLAIVIAAIGAIYTGSTGAFFSDTETSSGNVFTAGAIDLKIDNESYYNGIANASTYSKVLRLQRH
jgi:predicted ribosomally synthesized peptide with SipW-like signal peptide